MKTEYIGVSKVAQHFEKRLRIVVMKNLCIKTSKIVNRKQSSSEQKVKQRKRLLLL